MHLYLFKDKNAYTIGCKSGNKFNGVNGTSYASGIKGAGSIIIMTLNTLKKTLSFNIDNKDYGIAFNNLPNKKYRFAVDIYSQDDEIMVLDEIIEYNNNAKNNNNNKILNVNEMKEEKKNENENEIMISKLKKRK